MLIHCPECAHEVSTNAVACPNCGRPLHAPPVEERHVVAEPINDEKFPPWAIAAIGLTAVGLILFAVFMFRSSDDERANVNVNVNAAARRTASEPDRDSRTTSVPPSDTQTVTVPSAPVSIPPPPVSVPGSSTTVPGSDVAVQAPDRGTVVINARVAPSRGGSPRPVSRGRFYLLEEDVETILSRAGIEPIEGNSLTASLGLAIVYPERYSAFSQAAMRAIANRSKHSAISDATGKADLRTVQPDQYFLFGIVKVGPRGFAMWNSPVTIVPGENIMNLSPQSVTEVPEG